MNNNKSAIGRHIMAALLIMLLVLSSCAQPEVLIESGTYSAEQDTAHSLKPLSVTTISEENRIALRESLFVGGGGEMTGVGGGDELEWYYCVFGFNYNGIDTYFIDIVGREEFRKWRGQFKSGDTPDGWRDWREANLRTFIEDCNISMEDMISAQEAIFGRPMAEIDALINWARYDIDTGFTDPDRRSSWEIRYSLNDLEALFSDDVNLLQEAFPGVGVIHDNKAYSPEWILNNIETAVLEEKIPLGEIERIIDLAEDYVELEDVVADTKAELETIIDDGILPESITLNQTVASISVGNNITLMAEVLPDIATDKTVSWTSSNNSVATINSSGVVTGVSAGTATITATTVNGLTATCEVTVDGSTSILPTSVIIEWDDTQGVYYRANDENGLCFEYDGNTIICYLKASVYPVGADQTVIWSSSDPYNIPIDENGVITIDTFQVEATITATAANGATATFIVSVTHAQR